MIAVKIIYICRTHVFLFLRAAATTQLDLILIVTISQFCFASCLFILPQKWNHFSTTSAEVDENPTNELLKDFYRKSKWAMDHIYIINCEIQNIFYLPRYFLVNLSFEIKTSFCIYQIIIIVVFHSLRIKIAIYFLFRLMPKRLFKCKYLGKISWFTIL